MDINKNELKQIIKEALTEVLSQNNLNNISETRSLIREALIDFARSQHGEDNQLNKMARVGFMNGQEYEVYVRTNDAGFIPHVHIFDVGTNGRKFDCCVQLETNKYFSHGKHTSVMNEKLCKDFAEFMEQPCRNPKYKNNYELAVDMWNLNNSSSYVQIRGDSDGNIIIPNYRTITHIEDS